jgi:peptidoglycan/LPS O-acetylase OafA/YrhL
MQQLYFGGIMLDLGYVGAIVGTSLGVLGAVTGVLGSLARKNPEKYLNKLRKMGWFDIGVGCLLAGGGVVIWFGSSADYWRDLAEILFYAGALLLGIIAVAFSEFFDRRSRIRKFVHVPFASGVVLLALAAYSHLTATVSLRTTRETIWGAILLILYAVFLFVLKSRTNSNAQATS